MIETDDVDVVFAIAAQFTNDAIDRVTPVTDGAINQTFEVVTCVGEKFIVQGMSHIFSPTVLTNLRAVQPALRVADVSIPDCIPSLTGDLYIQNHDRWYRALTYVSGITIHDGITPQGAKSAGELIGTFHSALVESGIEIVQPISHFHETEYYIKRLNRIATEQKGTEKGAVLQPLVDEVLERYHLTQRNKDELPLRIIHADLKVSNIRFNDSLEAVGLIDMDTMMESTIQVDMGDALRSWCGTAGEDNSEQIFDRAVYEAAMEGYRKTAYKISHNEIQSIPDGIQLMTLELTARFLADAYEEVYFAPSSNYSSLYEQNKNRAMNQLRFLNALEASGIL